MSALERHWSSLPGFSVRFAIRMPNGQLYAKPAVQQPKPAPSLFDSLLGLHLGQLSDDPPPPPEPPKPEIFENHAQAEALLTELREMAARFGVTEWGGTIVAQLCTPFTSGDPTIDFAEQIVAWLTEQGGAR